jgi:hypothetical protein
VSDELGEGLIVVCGEEVGVGSTTGVGLAAGSVGIVDPEACVSVAVAEGCDVTAADALQAVAVRTMIPSHAATVERDAGMPR